MRRVGIRPLVVPAALAVGSFVLLAACGDDETSTLPACADLPSSGCEKCVDSDGNVDCRGAPECFYDEDQDRCDEAIA